MPSRKNKRAKRDKYEEKAALRAAQVELVKLQRHVIVNRPGFAGGR